jgi:hypothetical protein
MQAYASARPWVSFSPHLLPSASLKSISSLCRSYYSYSYTLNHYARQYYLYFFLYWATCHPLTLFKERGFTTTAFTISARTLRAGQGLVFIQKVKKKENSVRCRLSIGGGWGKYARFYCSFRCLCCCWGVSSHWGGVPRFPWPFAYCRSTAAPYCAYSLLSYSPSPAYGTPSWLWGAHPPPNLPLLSSYVS